MVGPFHSEGDALVMIMIVVVVVMAVAVMKMMTVMVVAAAAAVTLGTLIFLVHILYIALAFNS
jgi:hypothetical protein